MKWIAAERKGEGGKEKKKEKGLFVRIDKSCQPKQNVLEFADSFITI